MKMIIRHCITVFLVACCSVAGQAQSGPYGNEWIDYSKTYYKFKVTKAGVYRINRATLTAAGLPASVTGANFKLYRDGREVRLYVSADNMTATDYIEFVGRGADGILDKELYADPAWQPDTRISMFTDTAAYYLTYDNGNTHLRYQETPNNIPGAPPAAETYNWTTVGNYYKEAHTEGPSYDDFTGGSGSPNPGNPFFSPSFENGEGLVARQMARGDIANLTLATPNLVTGVNALLNTSVTTRSYRYTHSMNIAINGTQVTSGNWGISETKHFNQSFSSGQLSANNTITYTPVNPQGTAYDIYGVSYVELQYPRNYDMNGLSFHSFRLNASNSSQYLEFTNFSAPSRLYDLTNQRWYTGNVNGTTTRFYIEPSVSDRELALINTNTGTTALTIAKTIQFTDYRAAVNQGDYVIVTHSKLMEPVSGHNYVDEYRAYRASVAGGSHKIVVADVTELYDAFGYGYETHPQSIRHFLQYAYENWVTKPASVNMIGRGLQYEQYKAYYAAPNTYTFPIVPIYGNPGSDVNYVNFGTTRTQKMQIGRVSVWNAEDLGRYLTKIKSYEIAIRQGDDANALWKKKVMHLSGGTSAGEVAARRSTLNAASRIIEDTLMGASIYNFEQNSTSPVSTVQRNLVDSLINGGLNMITYFGHASPTTLGYNLPDPETYRSNPRFPVFIALGCDIAQMFGAFTTRTLSERYTLAETGGSIAMLATDNYGYTGFLDNYLYAYYRSTAYQDYGGTVGRHTLVANNKTFQDYCSTLGITSSFYFAQIESQILTGDPAIPVFGPDKPDYHISNNSLTAIPGNVSTALDSFQLRIVSYNLGRALRDSVAVTINHISPAGTNALIKTFYLKNLYNTDTTSIWIPVSKTSNIGLNKYVVKIDAPNKFDESSELNNEGTLDVFIYNDNLVPVYPHEFSIVYKPGVTLKASTLNPFRPVGQYVMEIDTTTAFNSPSKLQTTIVSRGGIIKWTPNLIMKDSTVYYWRAAVDSTVNGIKQWSGSSFIYLAKGSDGWNQSHYFQYLRDGYTDMSVDNDRIFKYDAVTNKLIILNKVMQDQVDGDSTAILYNGGTLQTTAQGFYNLQIMVIDSTTGAIWKNSATRTAGARPPSGARGVFLREFDMSVQTGRIAAARYLKDTIPNGNTVIIRNVVWNYPGQIVSNIYNDTWKGDTVVMGSGISLYHVVRDMGFSLIDSFTSPRAFIFVGKKGDLSWPQTQQKINQPVPNQGIAVDLDIKGLGTTGQARSTVLGPAKAWETLKWRRSAKDGLPGNDSATVVIYGIPLIGADSLLYTGAARDTSLAFIDAARFPRIRMAWNTVDSITSTPPQLDYWRVLYSPIPEAALNPAAHFAFADSLAVGQQQHFEVAIENLTEIPMDSMLVNYKIITANGITSFLDSPRYRPLPGLDTIHASVNFDPANYTGNNFLFIEANPNNDQPEQYHPNNLGYIPFNITTDRNNPLLDVTFDGAHILSGDIVSSKPFIKVTLKDDNKFLALDTSSLLKVTLIGQRNSTVIDLPFDGKICKFIPAQPGVSGKNEAMIEIRPDLVDNVYTLTVEGRDRSGNHAGTPQGSNPVAKYKTDFEVINKATITNVLNYPNPFSTSTAFLFTITGSQLPSQFKIQILSVTGKVVREITKDELGPLRIGRNITEYKWDGRDQYGQLLGNGVYMYRVATSLNGNSIEHRADMDQQKDNSGDKFFKNGYGKMYIMR
jgi:hypothetical protein